jgi:hypothetical protein
MRKSLKASRTPIIRSSLVILWIAAGILLFIFNRGHTLLIDNKDIDNFTASNLIKVTIDKKKSFEFFRGDRDIFKAGGGRHRLDIEYSDGTPPFTAEFSLPLGPDMFLLSIPRFTNGAENAIEVFHQQRESRNAEEEAPAEEL